MIFVFLFHIYSAAKEENTSRHNKCKGPHTFINGTGFCECSADFPFGDPLSEIGCWTCNPPCDLNAHCYGPDQCRCNEGYIGDGLDVCEKPVPNLKGFTPKSANIYGNEKITALIHVNAPNYTTNKGYCRFGPIIVEADTINTTHITCTTQKGKEGVFPISVSFDGVHWSTENYTFIFNNDKTSQVTILFGFISCSLIIILGFFVFWYFHKTDRFMEQADEVLPLTKWHMNTPKITPQSEQTWLDFLWNIIIE